MILKSIFDVGVSFILLVLLSPIFFILMIVIRVMLGSPVFFLQQRVGLNEKIFQLVKFRSMTGDRDAEGHLLSDEKRLTKLGRFLRSTSLDELPGLWNVLRREMSLVGPRPLLVEYLPLYNNDQKRRHTVLPGITGWAQINGRNLLSWEDKFKLDLWYVEHKSFFLDLKILFLTLLKVLKRDGIDTIEGRIPERFTGMN